MKREEPLISVIVPVYNTETYVAKCLDSILAQTYENIQVVVVDDASQDGSGGICDAYEARDRRVKVLHFPVNRGLSAARNQGVREAAGQYAAFVDSDDYVEHDMLEKLYKNMAESGADVSICGTYGIRGDGVGAAVYTRGGAARCLARRAPFLWTAWGKLYLTDDVRRHPFSETAFCCEDLLFFYQLLKRAERISYVPQKLYHYVYRGDSLINGAIDEKRCTVLGVLDEICRDVPVDFPEAEDSFRQLAMDAAARLAMQAVEGGVAEGELEAYLKRFQKCIRRHFGWKALLLGSDLKVAAGEMALYASVGLFRKGAALYKRKKRPQSGGGHVMEWMRL